jgi:ABC-type dipeptide/oligopeptide/nickel transport system permease subunit
MPRRLRPLVLLLRDPFTCVSFIVLLGVVVMALSADLIAPNDPNAIDPFNTAVGPSADHWFGTDENGRDVLSRIIYGSRVSLLVGVLAVGLGTAVGVPLGLIAGYAGRNADAVIMRVMDAILAFPAIILALGLVALLGSGIVQLMIAIGITTVPIYARILRVQTMSLKAQDFVLAARSTGATAPRIMMRHILPNTIAPIIVQGSLGMAFAILAEAGLSFLGLGVEPPTATWGSMLQKSLPRIYDASHLSIFPGVAIFIVVLAFNIIGDNLRDVLDPRLRER